MEQFIKNSINPNNYVIEDVEHDNACFYNCIATILKRKDNYREQLKINIEDIQKEAFKIQKKIVNWIFKNRHKKIDELGLTLEELVIYTHNLMEDYDINNLRDVGVKDDLMKEYKRRYRLFAGDDIEDEYDRWGGASEQYAISEILKRPIHIYHYKKYDVKKDKIVNGRLINHNKVDKNTRFILAQVFGEKYDTTPIYLLYQNNNKVKGHYYCLYHI